MINTLVHVIGVPALLLIGFGLGRVKHPSNLKVANIRIAIQNYEASGTASAKKVLATIKSYL